MKTAIYIEDGVVQLVITPESDFEKNALKSFDGDKMEAEIFTGTFYDCKGGWTRHRRTYNTTQFDDDSDKSLILRHTVSKSDV